MHVGHLTRIPVVEVTWPSHTTSVSKRGGGKLGLMSQRFGLPKLDVAILFHRCFSVVEPQVDRLANRLVVESARPQRSLYLTIRKLSLELSEGEEGRGQSMVVSVD